MALLCVTSSVTATKNSNDGLLYGNSDNYSNIEILKVASNEVTFEDCENFNLDVSYAKESGYIISQKEIIEIEPVTYIAPEGWYFSDSGVISQLKNFVFKSDTYTEPGGYVTLTTTAYQIGIYDGNVVYRIASHADINKSFFFDKKDNLIIRMGENATFYDGIACNGTSSVYDIKNGGHDLLGTYNLTPNFSKGPGVLYEFDVVQDTGPGDSYNPRQTTVDGNYYTIATNTTDVQSVYVHNQKLFTDSLSFSFGPVGINIPLGRNEAAVYYATPLTLDGYDDVLQRKIHTIKQEDYGFEQQYYFSAKSAQHSIDGLNFTTNRLRCGYIENEYINLSAQRKDAGTAYLEYKFDEPIFQMNTYLTFWSSSEQFQSGDIACIEYLDENGKWTQLFDLLNNNNPLPTDRTNPKLYRFNIIQGTKGIRFYSQTSNAYLDRNKGRICIGETKFITYNI